MARIGDKISFELQDELFKKGIKVVRAQIIRQYPKTNGLAFDCIDLDDPDIHYTIAADEKFISIND
jgi:hypothetical protein